MKEFIQLHQSDVTGVLSGFDRIPFRGTIRWLATEVGMMRFLWAVQMKLKDFVQYSQGLTTAARRYVEQLARISGRPVQYLNRPGVSKEDVARDFARKDGIREGLICVLSGGAAGGDARGVRDQRFSERRLAGGVVRHWERRDDTTSAVGQRHASSAAAACAWPDPQDPDDASLRPHQPGRSTITAFLAALQADTQKLGRLAA